MPEHYISSPLSMQDERSTQRQQHRTEEPQPHIGQHVLLTFENINIPNTAPKLKPRWLGPFPVTSTAYQRENYGLDLSTKPELSLIYNTCHISKLKPYLENKENKFALRRLSKPGRVEDDRYEVETIVK